MPLPRKGSGRRATGVSQKTCLAGRTEALGMLGRCRNAFFNADINLNGTGSDDLVPDCPHSTMGGKGLVAPDPNGYSNQ